MAKKKQKQYREPRYRLIVEYKGYDHSFDNRLTAAVGREEEGAGFFFRDDTRDISWSFHQKPALDRAVKRVKRFRKVTKIEVEDTVGEETTSTRIR